MAHKENRDKPFTPMQRDFQAFSPLEEVLNSDESTVVEMKAKEKPTARFQFTSDHLIENLDRNRERQGLNGLKIAARILLLFVFLAWLAATIWLKHWISFSIPVVTLIYVLSAPRFTNWYNRINFYSSPYHNQVFTFYLSADGFLAKCDLEETRLPWARFEKVVYFDDGFLLPRSERFSNWIPYTSLLPPNKPETVEKLLRSVIHEHDDRRSNAYLPQFVEEQDPPPEPVATTQNQTSTDIDKISQLFRQGDYGLVIAHSQQYLQLKSHLREIDPRIYCWLGYSHYVQADFAPAIEHLCHDLALNPNSELAHKTLANIYSSCPQEQFHNGAEAIKHAHWVCELTDWKDWWAVQVLVTSFMRVGDFASAKKHISKCLQLANESQRPFVHVLQQCIGKEQPFTTPSKPYVDELKSVPKLFREHDYAAVIRLVQQHLDSVADPELKDSRCYGWLAFAYFSQNDFANAIRYCHSELAMNPDSEYANITLANIYSSCPQEEFHDGQAAIKHARHACEVTDWQKRHAIEVLVTAYMRSGEFSSAKRYADKCLRMVRESQQSHIKMLLQNIREQQPYTMPIRSDGASPSADG